MQAFKPFLERFELCGRVAAGLVFVIQVQFRVGVVVVLSPATDDVRVCVVVRVSVWSE